MFHFELTELMQVRVPARIRREIVRDPLGQKNVVRITAVHHPLGYVHPGPSEIRTVVYIHDFVDRPAVNPHAQRNTGTSP